MKNQRTRHALLMSMMSILLCIAMLIGSTFAWFTDTASTSVNKIEAGKLKVDIVDEAGTNSIQNTGLKFKSADNATEGEVILWEPNCTYRTEGFKIKNAESLALKYKMAITGLDGDSKLLEVIEFSVVKKNDDGTFTAVDLNEFEGTLASGVTSEVLYIQGHMDENAGNAYKKLTLEGVGITVSAAQAAAEYDSNGNTYDAQAKYKT